MPADGCNVLLVLCSMFICLGILPIFIATKLSGRVQAWTGIKYKWLAIVLTTILIYAIYSLILNNIEVPERPF